MNRKHPKKTRDRVREAPAKASRTKNAPDAADPKRRAIERWENEGGAVNPKHSAR